MEKFKKLKTLINVIESDVKRFYYDQDKATVKKILKDIQDLKLLANEIRKEIPNKRTNSNRLFWELDLSKKL